MSLFSTTLWTVIGQAKAGSETAVRTILSRYRPPLLAYLKQRGVPEADAEDIVQEVLLQMCEEEFLQRADRAKGKFRTLLIRVTQHLLTDEMRRRSSLKRGGGHRFLSLDEALEVAVSEAEEERFNEVWAQSILRAGLERLREDSSHLRLAYRDALVLRYFEGLSQQQIAEKLGCKETDVENYLRYGKDRLKKILSDLTREYSSSEEEHLEELLLLQRYDPARRSEAS